MRDRIPSVLLPALAASCLLLAGAPSAAADGASTAYAVPPAPIKAGLMDLLPFDDIAYQDFRTANAKLLSHITSLQNRVGEYAKKLQARKDKNDAESKRLKELMRPLRIQVTALYVRLTDALLEAGVDGSLIAYLNNAPRGNRRAQRFSYGLVLLLDDLSGEQRALFERVVAQVEAAEHAISAQKERTLLALKQTKLDKDEVRQIARTFDVQIGLIEQRFWQLTDYALSDAQRAKVWHWLPRPVKRKSQAVEHLYTLPGLTPSQGTRLKSLLTEVEHESSPDNAAVKRLTAELKEKGADRSALGKERGLAYQRLTELRRYAAKATREILTDEQWLAYEAIPPHVSTNERRANYNRVLGGWTPDGDQARRISALRAAARKAEQAARKRTQELQRKRADYGSDSPQMAGMEMEMAGMRADGERAQREFIGRVFREVMTPDDVGAWVMGHYGYKR